MPQPRKSLDEHKLQNTKARYVEPASDVPAGRPKFPKDITSEEKPFFKQIVKLLSNSRTCTAGDAELIRLLTIARTRHARALEHIRAEGEICAYTRLDSNGQPHEVWKENLWLKVATDAEKLQMSALDRLGLTPLNRGKIKPTKEEPKPDAAEAALLSREAEQQPVEDEPDLSLIHEELVN
jgi:P27 family predicted phage terminase small subunit